MSSESELEDSDEDSKSGKSSRSGRSKGSKKSQKSKQSKKSNKPESKKIPPGGSCKHLHSRSGDNFSAHVDIN